MINTLIKNLKKDSGYYESWKANIAMAFKDEYGRCEKRYKNRNDIHRIANKSADNFLNLLMGGK